MVSAAPLLSRPILTRDDDLIAQAEYLARHGPSVTPAADWGDYERQRLILLAHGCHAVKSARDGYYLVDGVKLSLLQMVCRARTLAKGKAKWQIVKAVGL